MPFPPDPPKADPVDGPHEKGAAWLLFALLFVLTFGIALGRSIAASLFLRQCGAAELAALYVLVSICVTLIVYVVSSVSYRVVAHRVAMVTVLLAAAAAVLFRFLLVESPPWLSLVFVVVVELAVTLGTVQFWTIANTHFSFAQARRRYAFIVTGGILGAAAGGSSTYLLTARIGVSTLDMLWVVVSLTPAALLLLGLYAKRYGDDVASGGNGTGVSGDFDLGSPVQSRMRGFLQSLRHPVLRTGPGLGLMARLACTALITVFATTMIDFQFKLAAKAEFASDPEGLTGLFGLFYLTVGVVTLVVQLLATPALTRSGRMFLGLGLTPAVLAVVTIGNIVGPGLIAVDVAVTAFIAMYVLKVLDSALSHSVNRSCREMVYTCLPEHLTGGFKALAEGVSGRVGLGLAGIALLCLSPETRSGAGLLLTLALLVAWLACVLWLRYRFSQKLAQLDRARQ